MIDLAHSVRVQIPGTWIDAHLYFGTLLLWNERGGVFAAKIEDIDRDIRANHGEAAANLVEYALFRNDWLAAESTLRLAAIPGVVEAVTSQVRAMWTKPIVVSSGVVKEQVGAETGEYVTDIAVYANRLFSATSAGLLEGRFNPKWRQGNLESDVEREVAHTISEPIGTVAVAYEQVAAASAAGVRTARFGENTYHDWRSAAESRHFKRAPVHAHAASFGAYALLAYGHDPAPSLLRGNKEFVTTDETRYGKTVISDFRGPSDEIDELLGRRFDERDWRVLGNGIGTILVETPQGLQVLRGVKDWNSVQRVDRSQPDDPKRGARAVYSTHPLNRGFVVEHLDSIGVIDEYGYRCVSDLRPNRIRTFPASKRHKGVMAVLTDSACELAGLVGRVTFPD